MKWAAPSAGISVGWRWPAARAEPERALGVRERLVVAVQERGGRAEVGGGVDAGAELLVGHRGEQRGGARRRRPGPRRCGRPTAWPSVSIAAAAATSGRSPSSRAAASARAGPVADRVRLGAEQPVDRELDHQRDRVGRRPGPGARSRPASSRACARPRGGRAGARRRRTSSSAARAGRARRPARARCSRAGRRGSRRGGPARRARGPGPAGAAPAARGLASAGQQAQRGAEPAGGAGGRAQQRRRRRPP